MLILPGRIRLTSPTCSALVLQIMALAMLMVAQPVATQPKDTADVFPNRPIRLIVAYPPGGSVDTAARVLGHILSSTLGQQVVIDNRPGGGGSIGNELVARATPDGYTLILAISGVVTGPLVNPKLSFDPVKDFTPIIRVATSAYNVIVNPSVPASTIQELRTLVMSNPGKLNYGTPGYGSGQHLAIELFRAMSGLNIVHVPYRGAAPAQMDLIAGRIQLMFGGAISSLPHIKAGRLRALAVTGRARSMVLPELPTLAETIVAGYEAVEWFGALAPAKLPAPLVSRWHKEIAAAMNTTALQEVFVKGGAVVETSTPQEFGAFILAEKTKWARVVAQAKITPE